MGKASRDTRDIYYRKAKEEGWCARSAIKLLHIDGEFNLFVLSRKLYLPAKLAPDAKDEDLPLIVAIDLQSMAPVEGVIQVQGDITNARTAEVVIRHFDGCKAGLVVCHGAPDVSGLLDMDEFVQSQFILALKLFFPAVTFAKPKSSRNFSIEAFAVSENYSPPEGLNPKDLYRLLEKIVVVGGWKPNKMYIPFVACGDLSGYDSDRSYPLPKVAGGTYRAWILYNPQLSPLTRELWS